jgi:hypothetical protein
MVLALVVAASGFAAACATQPQPEVSSPGFFMGLIHGWASPFSLIMHIFNRDVRVYAFPNSGGWYDLGFLIGVGSLGGAGGSATR